MGGLFAAAAGLGAGLYLAYVLGCPAAQVWGPGFHRGPRGRRWIALTFDDGPSESTPRILETLARYGVRATFFVCGENVRRLPAEARAIAAAGHELGNHTASHPRLLRLSPQGVRRELREAQQGIEDAAGVTPRLFRPPYGLRSPFLPAATRELSLTTVMWTVSGADWNRPAEAIARKTLAGADAGAIVCLHDGDRIRPGDRRRETARALERIIPALRKRGYVFVTCGEMLEELKADRSSPARLAKPQFCDSPPSGGGSGSGARETRPS